jgi:hypothetical protein
MAMRVKQKLRPKFTRATNPSHGISPKRMESDLHPTNACEFFPSSYF